MTHPRRFLLRMALFLAVVAGVVVALLPGLEHAFSHNIGLNSVIVGVLLVGIVLNFRQVMMLDREVRWVEGFRRGQPATSIAQPRLLSPLVTMVGERERFVLSPPALRSVLDGISTRLDESREISSYFIGLMIFLGLLGTFWGLSQTVGSIGDVIRNLTFAGDNVQSAFEGLKSGLDAPLTGMGTAFSCSLIGLSGSLVVGFLDLQAGQAQNSFYNDLEEWLSGQVRLTSGGIVGTGDGPDQPVPAYIQALLEQTAESLDNLQRTLAKGEEGRISANTNMRQLTDRLSTLADQMKTEQALMLKLAENQIEMRPLLAKIAEGSGASGLDDASRNHIRNIDMLMARMAEEMSAGREAMVRDIRSEFRFLARTIAALADDDAQARAGGGRTDA